MAEPEVEQAVERVERFEAAPDELWDAITDPELLAEWFGPLEIDLTPGGAITVAEPDSDGAAEGASETIGVVETVEPPHRIGFVWVAPGSSAPSEVELEIDPGADGSGSILRVREARIEPRWDDRPAWFSSTPRACAGAGVAFGARA